jgi:hypothetical protein
MSCRRRCHSDVLQEISPSTKFTGCRLHGMVLREVLDEEDKLQIQRIAMNVLFWTANKG